MNIRAICEPSASPMLSAIRSRPRLKATMKKCLEAIGYDTTDWVRVAMYRHAFDFIARLGPERLHVMEVSAGSQWRSKFAFKSFTGTSYPAFDICQDVLPEQFDLIIADQVFEHLKWPARAARNVYAMVRPGGHFLIATPFLVRYHPSPIDCNRWTPEGLSCLLQEAGFPEAGIQTFAWGNRSCVKANLSAWRKRGFFGSLRNEPDVPIMVWAYARKPLQPAKAETIASLQGRPMPVQSDAGIESLCGANPAGLASKAFDAATPPSAGSKAEDAG